MTIIASLYRWAVGLLYVGLVCVVVIVCSLFLRPRSYDPLFKAMMRGLFRLLHVPVEVRGGGKVRSGSARLFMANHVSFFDAPLLGGYLPGMVRGVEWESHFRWPLFGLFLRRVGNIPIDRDNTFSSMKSLRRARLRLAAGQSLVILPEAHRTRDGSLGHFKRLPFLLAREAGVDLVPVGLSGLYSLNNKQSWIIGSSRLKVAIGDPIPAAEVRARTVDELWRLTRQRIERLIERP